MHIMQTWRRTFIVNFTQIKLNFVQPNTLFTAHLVLLYCCKGLRRGSRVQNYLQPTGNNSYSHRRRIELEDKAKVVAENCRTESLCRASCFASVFLKQSVELNHLFQDDQGKTAGAARGTVEVNCLFQKDRGKTAIAARILSPNPTTTFALSSNSILLLCLQLLQRTYDYSIA